MSHHDEVSAETAERALELEEETYKFRLPFAFHNFPIEVEDLPVGPLAIASGIVGGVIHLSIARYFPALGTPSQNSVLLASWSLFGVIWGVVGSVKLVFWLDDQIQDDRRRLQKRNSKRGASKHL